MIFFILLPFAVIPAAGSDTLRVEPPFWWAGMRHPSLQLLVHYPGIGTAEVKLSPYPGVTLDSVIRPPNRNYLFLHLTLSSEMKPGRFDILFLRKGKSNLHYGYILHKRETGSARRQGFGPGDVILLLMPDRFANGDTTNDNIRGMREKTDRTEPYGRHGGDIAGIMEHLDEIRETGYTALWTTPVLENDQDEQSYHGYAITDFYKVDPRFGSNRMYRQLGHLCREKGIKLIMDMVFNHCGSRHWWMDDLPFPDWIHDLSTWGITNHMHSLQADPHASENDLLHLTHGWFVPSMPDLGQENPFLQEYLIQNSIWWIEYAGLEGIRMDTYPYNNKVFMSRWTERVLAEYPRFTIVGEEWSFDPALVSYWQKGRENTDGYRSGLPALMDFPFQHALVQALTEPESWNTGWKRLYTIFSDDQLYPDPLRLVIFADNHDMDRFFRQISGDTALARLGLALLLTARGIPQIFYGTDILMSNPLPGDHGTIRADYPGGWPGDTTNAFTGQGLPAPVMRFRREMQKLLRWRKAHPGLMNGEMIHFIPADGVYVFFRKDGKELLMTLLNKNDKKVRINPSRFSEILGTHAFGTNLYDGRTISLIKPFVIPPKTPMILEIK